MFWRAEVTALLLTEVNLPRGGFHSAALLSILRDDTEICKQDAWLGDLDGKPKVTPVTVSGRLVI